MAKLSMVRGDTYIFDTTVTNKDGAVNLTGKVLIFTMKKNISDADNAAVCQKKTTTSGITVTNAALGMATVTLAPADTRSLSDSWQTLYWDLQLIDGASIFTVAKGTMEVTPDVTISTS